MRTSRIVALVAMLPVLFNGCRSGGSLTEPGSWLKAMSGDDSRGFEGTGYYALTGPPAGTPRMLSIVSWGSGESKGQSILIWGNTDRLPAPGTYSFGLPNYDQPVWTSFAAVFDRGVSNGAARSYVAWTGSLVVARASDARIEGTFSFTALLFCQRPSGVGSTVPSYGTCSPKDVDVNAPTIEVTGSFSAGPDTAAAHLLRD